MKKKGIGKLVTAFVVLAAIITGFSATYVVNPKEYAAVRQFGKIVNIKDAPGLYLKAPFIQNVQKIPGATVLYDIPASDVITKDKKSMIADNYVLWQVVEPASYVRTLGAVTMRAEERIEAAVYNATKNVISSMTQDEVIEARGEKLTQLITEEANSDISGYGVRVIKAEIKSLDLPDDNKESVYERMISERQNIAASYKAEGDAEAQKIRNAADKSVAILEAEANRQAAIVEAEGEAEYMRILQEAYNTQDKADFYNYLRSLDAVEKSLQGDSKTIILDKNSELARVLYGDI